MADLNTNLAALAAVAANPRAKLDEYLNAGRKVVGCFPVYTPEVLVDAAGMIPMGLWGAQTEFSHAKSYLPPFACPIMQANMEMGITGAYRGVSAVMIPAMCDTLRNVSQDFKKGVPDITCIPFTFPQNRKIPAAMSYLVSEFTYVKEALETICGKAIEGEDIVRSIEIYNEHNVAVRTFSALANRHLDIITPVVRHAVMKSGQFMPKEEHTKILKEINTQLLAMPTFDYKGKRVILTGITAEPDQLLNILSENNMAVVGDDLPQEMRQYRTDIPDGGKPLERLARQWMDRSDPMAHDADIRRGDLLLGLVRENRADGVILCLMKFCDPEEYEYPVFLETLKAANVPVLSIDVDQQPATYDQARTRIQTFCDILS